MSQTLRWTPQQLEAHLKRLHGDEKTQLHPSMQALQGKSRMQTLLDAQSSLKSWDIVDVSKIRIRDAVDAVKSRPPSIRGDLGLLKNSTNSSLSPSTSTLLPTLTIEGIDLEKPPRRIAQRERAIASMATATWTGAYEAGKYLEIVFHGVVLLSVNTLYGLTHYERIKYRRKWHELVERAVSNVVGDVAARTAFGRYIVRVHRVSRRLADTDAKSGYLKYPIDGLRYSGVLVEDTETHFKDLLCSQALGLPALAMRIEAVGEDYVPTALQGSWAQGLLKTLAPEEKEEKKKPARKSKPAKSLAALNS